MTLSLAYGDGQEITEDVPSLQQRISQYRQSEETTEFQLSTISQQQRLLSINAQEIGEMCNRQASLTRQVSELAVRVEERNKESKIVRRKIESLTEKKCKLKMEMQALLHEIPVLDSKKADLEAEGQKLSEKVQRLGYRQQETKAWIRTREEQIAFRRQEVHEHDQTHRYLKKEQQEADDQLETLQAELNDHLAELQKLQKQKETSTGELETRKKRLKRVTAQSKELANEMRDLEKQQHDLETTLAALQKERVSLDRERRQRHDAIEQLRYKTEIQQQENVVMSRAVLCPDRTMTMQTPLHTAKRKDAIRREQSDARPRHVKTCSTGTMPVEIQNSTDPSLTHSKDVEFACASRSGDLLIRCLEKELKRQQEFNRKQTRTIEMLSEDLKAGRQRDANPSLRTVEQLQVDIQILFCVTGKGRGRNEN